MNIKTEKTGKMKLCNKYRNFLSRSLYINSFIIHVESHNLNPGAEFRVRK